MKDMNTWLPTHTSCASKPMVSSIAQMRVLVRAVSSRSSSLIRTLVSSTLYSASVRPWTRCRSVSAGGPTDSDRPYVAAVMCIS